MGVGVTAMKRFPFTWTSDATGVATVAIDGINGDIHRIQFAPDLTAAPTNNYSATVTDTNKEDVLAGGGLANQSSTVAKSFFPVSTGTDGVTKGPFAVDETLTINISGAGAAKKGLGAIYVR